MGLFRQEAMDASRERLQGEIMLVPQLRHSMLCLLLLAWLGSAAVFLTEASYSRKETVRGWLEPAAGVVRIYPQDEGRLAQLMVATGDSVARGQPLAIINGDRALPGGDGLQSLLLEEYRRQQANLERQLERQQSLQQVRRRELLRRLEDGGRQVAQLDQQMELLNRRIALAAARQARHRQLAAAGHITQAELDELQERALLLDAEQRELGLQRLRQNALLQEWRAALERLPGEAANSLDQLRLELSELSQEIARLRGRRAFVVQAPLAGEIANVGIAEGQKARYDKPLLTLLPAASPLVARLLVPVRAAGFIEAGQPLAIRYDAFPYQKYGLKRGRVTQLARSATLPADQALWPVPVNEPVFRVTAQLADTGIHARGERVPLKPGMTLSADVILEHRSLLQWLLEPLYSLRGRLS